MSHLARRITNLFFAFVLAVMSVNLSGVLSVQTAQAKKTANVTICHATNSQSNPYTVNTIDTASIDNSGNQYLNGHGDHTGPVWYPGIADHSWGDIIPPFENDAGHTFPGYNWDAAGQAIYDNGCVAPQDATANVSVSPATCDGTGVATVTGVAHATLTSNNGILEQSVGTHTAVFTADAGHYFPGYQTTLSVQYTITEQQTGDDCSVKDATASVTPTPATCEADGSATYAVEHATLNGTLDTTPGTHTATFTADAGHLFAVNNSSTLEVEYTVESMLDGEECPQPCDTIEAPVLVAPLSFKSDLVLNDSEDCPITVTPTEPTVVDKCGTDSDSYTIPSVEGVNYYVNGVKTPAGTYKTNGALSVEITAEPADGYTFGDNTYSWTLKFTNKACAPQPCVPGVVTGDQLATLMLQQHTNTCPTGNGGAGGSTPLELPQTGAAEGNTLVKIATIVTAGIMTYGAMFYLVNRRELSRK